MLKAKKMFPIIFILFFILVTIPVGLAAAIDSDHVNIDFTSDMHGRTDRLSAWLAVPASSGSPDLVVCGGDQRDYWSPDIYAKINMTIASVFSTSTPGVIYTTGNNEYKNGGSESLFYSTTGYTRTGEQSRVEGLYAIYTLGAASEWPFGFTEADIVDLSAYLASVDMSTPVFVVSHYPLHYGEFPDNWTMKNADILIDVLNQYPQVVFLWGHNHYYNYSDTTLGSITESGGSIDYNTGSTFGTKTINFTYVNAGAMQKGRGMCVQVDAESGDVEATFQLYDYLEGPKGTPVTIAFNQTPTVYSVSYNEGEHGILAGADESGSVVHSGLLNDSETPAAPIVTPEAGYTFSGWVPAVAGTVTENATYVAQYIPKEYTLIFRDWDGTVLNTQMVTCESTVIIPENPTRSGYTFTGWDVPYMDLNADEFEEHNGEIVVTAQYDINSYTVTFVDYNGTTVLKTQTVAYGAGAAAPADPDRPADAQYTYSFDKWDKPFTNITEDLTVKAIYNATLNSYTVTFLDYDGAKLSSQTVEYGTGATAPADPIRTGYTFTGWDADFSNITGDLTVTALYATDTFTVTFVDWNGTTLSTQTVAYGSSAAAPADPTGPANAQYTYSFDTWDKDFTNITEDLTVTAIYTATLNIYTVTFWDYDGTTLSTQNVAYGSSAAAPADPTRPADAQYTYSFDKWDKAFTNITEDLTVTAIYTATLNSYTVTFLDYDGTTLSSQTVEYGAGAAAPADPSRDGYTFTGWDPDFSSITSDLTVTAQYAKDTLTVTFVDWNGTTLSTQTVAYGAGATAPPDPDNKANYHFTDWDTAFDNVTGDLTVTAQYAIDTFTVTFVDWNGTTLSTQTVAYGAGATAPADPIRTGYTFTGWDTDFSSITSYLTVTAQYIIDTFTISVSANPSVGGSVSGGGYFASGESVTVAAIAKAGYVFVNWTEDSTTLSTSASYTFTMGVANRGLVANFQADAPPNVERTTVSVDPSTVQYSDKFNIQAVLKAGSTPIVGKTLYFELNGKTIGKVKTNKLGEALLSQARVSLKAGTYPVKVYYLIVQGSQTVRTAEGTAQLTVIKEDASVAYNTVTTHNNLKTIYAKVSPANDGSLGDLVMLQVKLEIKNESATVFTKTASSSNAGDVSFPDINLAPGQYTLVLTILDNNYYSSANSTTTVTF